MTPSAADLMRLTVQIVSAQCSSSKVSVDALPKLIRTVYDALATVGAPAVEISESPIPKVPIKKSLFPQHIVCLEDGKKMKMLKRHLQTAYGMTPDAYRAKWGLPPTYPMVAPDYAERRRVLARQIGLGHKVAKPRAHEEKMDVLSAKQTAAPLAITRLPERKRGRRKV